MLSKYKVTYDIDQHGKLPASHFTTDDPVKTASTRSAAASSTCSQLSKTKRRSRAEHQSLTDFSNPTPGVGNRPSASDTGAGREPIRGRGSRD